MDKKISELDQALQINNDAVFPMSQDNSGTDTTYKASITQLSTEIGEGQTFSNLQTTNKSLVGAINEINQGGGGGGSSNVNLAPDYDSASTYAVGDWCIYNGTLYQCNTAIPTAEAFDPTHWTAKKVVDAFADIEDELDDKVDTADFTADLLPIQSGSSTNTKDYIESKTTPQSISGISYNSTNINSGTFTCYKIGRLVMLDITALTTKIAIGYNEEELLSGLPLPLMDTGRYSLFDGDGTARARVRVTTDGKLRMWHNPSNFTVGTGFYGNVYYISAN